MKSNGAFCHGAPAPSAQDHRGGPAVAGGQCPPEARGGGRRRGARRGSVVVRFGEFVGGRVLGRGPAVDCCGPRSERPTLPITRHLARPRLPRDSRPRPVHERPPTPSRSWQVKPTYLASTSPGNGYTSSRSGSTSRSWSPREPTPPQPPWSQGRVAGLDRRLPGPPRAASSASRLRDRSGR